MSVPHSSAVLFAIMLAMTLSCGKQAPTVNPTDITTPAGAVTTGYYYPEVVQVYPTNGSTGNPTNTKFVIIFNIPINTTTLSANISANSSTQGPLTEVTDYTIVNGPSPVTVVTIEFTGSMSPIPDNDTITITIGSGIRDLKNNVSLNNPSSYTFSVGSTADTTNPAIIAGSNTPTDGSIGISRTAPGISIQFNETIDVSSLNNLTFYLEKGGERIPCSIGYVAPTATLTPLETLLKNTYYTVYVTTGIKDLSGNTLASPLTWSFTTENTEIDPVPGVPTITSSLNVVAVTTTSADLSWATNEATNYTLIWGRNSDATGYTEEDLGAFTSLHALQINPPFPGKRYYAQLSAYQDIAGISGGPGSIVEFNTLTDETPSLLASGPNNQHSAYYIPHTYSVTNSGAFVFWTNQNSGNRHLYAQRFNDEGNPQWAFNGLPLADNAGTNYYYYSALEDHTGGFIVLYSINGNGIYAKRFDTNGAIQNWGIAADETTDTGIMISANGTNVSAVPVYTNTVTEITSGTATHGSMALPNWFFEDDFDVLSLVIDGDIIYDYDNFEGTTIDINSVTPDYNYIIGQDSVQAVSRSAAENYIIADSSTSDTFTARDHNINDSANYTNGTNKVYSDHNYSPPVWVSVGDIVQVGTNYKRLSAINPITVSSIDSGTANAIKVNHLIDADADFSSVNIGDIVYEAGSSKIAEVTAVSTNDLTLNDDLFPLGSENYTIYDNTPAATVLASGTATSYSSSHLVDSGQDFGAAGVNSGDIVKNTSTNLYAIITNVTSTDLTLEWDAFPHGNEGYEIYENNTPAMTIIANGSAGARWANHLFDASATWGSVISVNDLVINMNNSSYTTVNNVIDDVSLLLNADIFTLGSENYEIYHNYCTTHTSTQIFYEFVLDGNLNAVDGSSVTIYNDKGISGISDIPPVNPLFDNAADFSGIINGDIILNFTDKLRATVTNSLYAMLKALDLDADIFTDGDSYSIIEFQIANTDASHIITWGQATSYLAGHLIDSSNMFSTVQPGDVVFNITDDSYAMVVSCADYDLTISHNIFDTGNERYLIYRNRGVLYVWEDTGNINGRIMSIEADHAPVDLCTSWTITFGSNPTAIADTMGNALLVYNNIEVNTQVVVLKLDGAGNKVWGPVDIDTQNTQAETIRKVMSDNAGGMIVLYEIDNNLRVQRIDSAGTRQWGNNGQAIGNPAAATDVDMVYAGGNDVIVVANIGNNIWACRVGSTSWAGYYISNAIGTQKNPKIFLNGADTIIVWEDDRFISFSGYGIFGMKIDADTGTCNVSWYADTSNTDLNGIAFVLNDYNEYWPNITLIPYNNGSGALLLWEDYRTPSEGINLFYDDITTFSP